MLVSYKKKLSLSRASECNEEPSTLYKPANRYAPQCVCVCGRGGSAQA